MTNCRNCNRLVTDNFCSNCGQASKLKRIDSHYIWHELLHLLHFEKGFLYNVKEFVLKPGHSARTFIDENRSKHMKPVAFLILSSLLYTIIAHLFHVDDIYNSKEKFSFGDSYISKIQQWVQTHWGYANILLGGFIAPCIRLFFLKSKYNFFEITVLICFVMGQGMVYLTLEAFFVKIIPFSVFTTLIVVFGFLFPAWAIGQFYGSKKWYNYVKALLAYIMGYILFQVAIVFVGLACDMLTRH
jgi:hypothetical protein